MDSVRPGIKQLQGVPCAIADGQSSMFCAAQWQNSCVCAPSQRPLARKGVVQPGAGQVTPDRTCSAVAHPRGDNISALDPSHAAKAEETAVCGMVHCTACALLHAHANSIPPHRIHPRTNANRTRVHCALRKGMGLCCRIGSGSCHRAERCNTCRNNNRTDK